MPIHYHNITAAGAVDREFVYIGAGDDDDDDDGDADGADDDDDDDDGDDADVDGDGDADDEDGGRTEDGGGMPRQRGQASPEGLRSEKDAVFYCKTR